jgi:hypothetical protein
MTRHYHVDAHELSTTLHNLNTLPPENIETLYGIKINEDGTVLDIVQNIVFDTVEDWAKSCAVQETTKYSEHTSRRKLSYED